MTEQPNTAAIRANYGPPDHPYWRDLFALCDALDAARTNIERAHAHREGHALAAGEAIARAEAAEARCDELDQARAYWEAAHRKRFGEWQAAEARIAAALAAYKAGNGTRCAADMARALTEGTGQ